jgi:Methyltransferase domain
MIEGYDIMPNGVIKQVKIFNELITYDEEYISTYEGFGDVGANMSYLRLGNIISSLGYLPITLLDVGYGNGDFLRACNGANIITHGTDISGYPVPIESQFIIWDNVNNNHFDVITFFDALEHFQDISFIKELKCNYVVISVPECHYFSDEWFNNWKHRKPDEHLWHFNKNSLFTFMKENGFSLINHNNVEDVIRKPIDHNSNILTAIFRHD